MFTFARVIAAVCVVGCAHQAHASRIQASGVVEFSATDLFDGVGPLTSIADGDSFTLDLPIDSYTEIADPRGGMQGERRRFRGGLVTDQQAVNSIALAATGAPVRIQFGEMQSVDLILEITTDADSPFGEGIRDEVIARMAWSTNAVPGSRGDDMGVTDYELSFYASFAPDTWDDFDPNRAISFADSIVTGFTLTDQAGGIAFGNELTSFTTPAPGPLVIGACAIGFVSRRRRA